MKMEGKKLLTRCDNYFESAHNPERSLIYIREGSWDIAPLDIRRLVSGVRSLKELLHEDYESLTFQDVFDAIPPLHFFARDIYRKNPSTFNSWMIIFYNRLEEEGLLGKSMRLPFSVRESIEFFPENKDKDYQTFY